MYLKQFYVLVLFTFYDARTQAYTHIYKIINVIYVCFFDATLFTLRACAVHKRANFINGHLKHTQAGSPLLCSAQIKCIYNNINKSCLHFITFSVAPNELR